MAPIQVRSDDNSISGSGGDGDGASGHSVTWAVNGLVIVLAIVSVALRFYTRMFTRAGLQADDWLILGALVTALATAALVLWGNTADPNGLRMSENTDPDYVYTPQDHLYLKLSFTCSVLYFTVSGAIKLGILLMYHRIFAVSTAFRYQLYVANTLVVGWWVGCTVAALRKCQSLETGTTSTLNDPRYCFNFNVFWLASGICEILLDALILTLPVSVVVRMRYSPKQKFIVSGIFLLGAFVIVTGVVKVYLAYIPGRRALSYANAEVWAALHSSMAILCASLPIFRPLVNRVSKSTLVTWISSLLSCRRGRRNSKSSDQLSESEKARINKPSRSLHLSFIASEMVQNLLKQPDAVYLGECGERPPLERGSVKKLREDEREHVPQLPQVETTEDIGLSLDTELANILQRDESSDVDHISERTLSNGYSI
ncbi:hypothetical protein F4819DRAFT_502537 [Hypoxylon fuscum]|nr:hypothetical protein F4819DRAFT_502537 [Hypoxylon fuscum]